VSAAAEAGLTRMEAEVESTLEGCLRSMRTRGGGFRGMEVSRLPETGLVRVEIRVDVRDAMGANLLNTAAERARGTLEKASGGKALMCILSNSARHGGRGRASRCRWTISPPWRAGKRSHGARAAHRARLGARPGRP